MCAHGVHLAAACLGAPTAASSAAAAEVSMVRSPGPSHVLPHASHCRTAVIALRLLHTHLAVASGDLAPP